MPKLDMPGGWSALKRPWTMVDIIRIDHFRGFAGYWEVPGKAKTAENRLLDAWSGQGFLSQHPPIPG